MSSSLLPTNATPWERALADAMPVADAAGNAITAISGAKLAEPRPSMLPFLVWEYGLGELTPYVPNLYELIDEGVAWQRLRGTVSAVAIGLAWIGYAAVVEEAWPGRRFWNSFQLRLSELPANDDPDLARIEGITSQSVPLRSKLRRGVFGYDVEAAQGDHTRLDESYLDRESGIATTQDGTLWSFGRTLEVDHTLAEAEGMLLGNWIDPPAGSDLNWVDLGYSWADSEFAWIDDPEAQRRSLMAAWFAGKTAYLVMRDVNDAVIGYRRCRALRPVSAAVNGPYTFGGDRYQGHQGAEKVFFEAMTQFADADLVECTSVSLIVDTALEIGAKPGATWLASGQVSGGAEFARTEVNLFLRKTIREQIKFLLRF